ncbi:hypothetical protein Q31b_01190 [Novipirellula aureliae]|uniref:Uncharacterized protein n=1 Tax=Novipirellula aureliae TaxID=2527966 RepID=A0A5C6E802_9BACT|nr:hypothetical protein Q31b_01190 [Novipirellula aureliae]
MSPLCLRSREQGLKYVEDVNRMLASRFALPKLYPPQLPACSFQADFSWGHFGDRMQQNGLVEALAKLWRRAYCRMKYVFNANPTLPQLVSEPSCLLREIYPTIRLSQKIEKTFS